jgi:hypothetical protein
LKIIARPIFLSYYYEDGGHFLLKYDRWATHYQWNVTHNQFSYLLDDLEDYYRYWLKYGEDFYKKRSKWPFVVQVGNLTGEGLYCEDTCGDAIQTPASFT